MSIRPKAPTDVAVMRCLRCGYVQKAHGGASYTREDRDHMKRCDYTMTIRYVRAVPRGRVMPRG